MPDFGLTASKDYRVAATVKEAVWKQAQTGTWGIEILFDLDKLSLPADLKNETQIIHTIWINANTANMAHKQLKSLGVDSDTVDRSAFRNDIGGLLKGAEGSLVVAEEPANEYHADPVLKVKFVNAPGASELPDDVDPLATLRARPVSAKKAKKKEPALPLETAVQGSIEERISAARGADVDESDVPF